LNSTTPLKDFEYAVAERSRVG